jgi:tetratricopeptide (TPR) repeat protein
MLINHYLVSYSSHTVTAFTLHHITSCIPYPLPALFNRAFAYDKVGLIEKAVEDYTAALGLDPGSAFAYYNRLD